MLREEELKKQASIYTDDADNYLEYSDDRGWTDKNDKEFVEKAFIEGAKWADANPKSSWISVKYKLPSGCWYWEGQEPTYWMQIPEISENGRIRTL